MGGITGLTPDERKWVESSTVWPQVCKREVVDHFRQNCPTPYDCRDAQKRYFHLFRELVTSDQIDTGVYLSGLLSFAVDVLGLDRLVVLMDEHLRLDVEVQYSLVLGFELVSAFLL